MSTPRLTDWDRAGRLLRSLSLDDFRQVLEVVTRMTDTLEGRTLAAPAPSGPTMPLDADLSTSEERAQARRRRFRVLDGGRSPEVARLAHRVRVDLAAIEPGGAA